MATLKKDSETGTNSYKLVAKVLFFANQRQPLRILYGVSDCTLGENYLLVSSHTVLALATPTGLEPVASTVTGWRDTLLHQGAV